MFLRHCCMGWDSFPLFFHPKGRTFLSFFMFFCCRDIARLIGVGWGSDRDGMGLSYGMFDEALPYFAGRVLGKHFSREISVCTNHFHFHFIFVSHILLPVCPLNFFHGIIQVLLLLGLIPSPDESCSISLVFFTKKYSYSSLNFFVFGRISRTGLPWVDPACSHPPAMN